MQGYLRRKSRPEAQQERPFQQRQFDGGQNSDTIATKIAANELALSKNTVHTPSDIQGHWGRKLFSPAVMPGTGRLHQVCQHPSTGRWLVHRGNAMYLSTDRYADAWVQVTDLGPDGALEATGAFSDNGITITGDAAAYLTGLSLGGVTPGQIFTIEVDDTGTGVSFQILIKLDGVTVSDGGNTYASTPGTSILTEVGGSGINGSVDVASLIAIDTPFSGTATVADYSVTFTLRGLTLENTDNWQLWWKVVTDGTTATITIYKDAAMTEAVGSGQTTNDFVQSVITGENESGIVGYFSQVEVSLLAVGSYDGSILAFEVANAEINADSTISPYGEFGFFVFARTATGSNIFVDQRIEKFWFLSTINGYGSFPILEVGPGDYAYRYLYTYSRLVNLATGEPDYSADRFSANLEFEGPSNLGPVAGTDYSAHYESAPISESDPSTFDLQAFVPTLGSPPTPAGANASAYITHLSIYRTLDIGIHGIGLDSDANYSEIYIWVADVPIDTTSYTDTTDDDILRNRFVGASTEQEVMSLRSRLWREMARGIGAIGPDFMVTAFPQAQQASYCDIAFNPRLIGFNFPGSQRFILQDPISEIYRTKDLFVFLCPSSTYTSVSAVNAETGIPGLIPVLTIQNFDPASKVLGIKYGQGVFPVDASSFVTLLSDGTVRVFSADRWGDPLEGTKLHKITEQAKTGAVFGFIKQTLLMWYRTSDGPDIAGPGAAVLSDIVLTGAEYETLYGKIELIEGGDAYTIKLYADSALTTLVALGTVIGLATQAQTVTIDAVDDSGISGSVYCDLTGYDLPLDFTVDFRQVAAGCLRLGTGGQAGNGWSVIDRPYWAYPGSWCGAIVVEDSAALLRLVAFDRADNSLFAVEDAPPLRQYTDDVATVYPGTLTGDVAALISNLSVYGLIPGEEYQVIITGVTPADVSVAIYKDVTPLAQFDGLVADQPLVGAVLAEQDDSGVSGTFDLSDYEGGYVMGTLVAPGVVNTSQAEIESTIALRELTGMQENYTCFHQESHVAVRPRYGQVELPAGLEFTVRGYENGVLNPGAVTTAAPADFDIQFFARLRGKQIQVEYESNKSGWRITSFDTQYQSQDMQSYGGPWNSVEGEIQAALSADLVSWLYGDSGLVDRASPVGASYVGDAPVTITGPSDTFYGQRFSTPVTRAVDVALQDYTLMLWVSGPTAGSTAAAIAAELYAAFPSLTQIDTGLISAILSTSVAPGNSWQHFAIVREGLEQRVYQNGALIGSGDVDGADVAVATITIGSEGATQDITDPRLYSAAKTAEQIAYYYNDVATNGGLRVLP